MDALGTSIEPTYRTLDVAGGRAVVCQRAHPQGDGTSQDAFLVAEAPGGRALLAVADGMGGNRGGLEAASVLVEALRRGIETAGPDTPALRSPILDAIEHANEAIRARGLGAATTLAAVSLEGPSLRPYHVGDSAILLTGQRGRIKLQTVAHSPVGYALEAGVINEREALHHEERHLVSNMIGAPDMHVTVGSRTPIATRDTVVIGSDGLFDNLTTAEIVEGARRGDLLRAAERLCTACIRRMDSEGPNRPSKPDDLTFILFRRRAAPKVSPS